MDDNIKNYIETEHKLKELYKKQNETIDSYLNSIINKLGVQCEKYNSSYESDKRWSLLMCDGNCEIRIHINGNSHYCICKEPIEHHTFNNHFLESKFFDDDVDINYVIEDFVHNICKHLPEYRPLFRVYLRSAKLERITKDGI